mgnify:CR=1 FL=1
MSTNSELIAQQLMGALEAQKVWGGVIVNVKEYGAKGNGAGNDRPAIQQAINAARDSGGGVVYFPYSDQPYMVDGVPLVLSDNIEIQGNGSTLKLTSGLYSDMTAFFTTISSLSGNYNPAIPITRKVSISNIILDGNLANVSTTRSCTGIHAYQVVDFRAVGIKIRDLPGSTGEGYGISTWYSERVWIEDCDVQNTDRQNYVIWETQKAFIKTCIGVDSRLRDCILVSTNTPQTYQASYCEIIGGSYSNTTASGTHVVRFSGAGSGILSGATLEGNSTIDCVYVTDTIYKSVRIIKNTLKNGLYGVLVESSTDKFVQIDGNEILNGTNGIRVNAAGGIVFVTGNKIKGQSTVCLYVAFATFKYISGNTISGGNTDNFIRAEASGTTVIDSNVFSDNTFASYTLLVGGDATAEPLILNNSLINNAVNEIRIATPGRAIGNTRINSSTVTFDYLNSRRVLYGTAAPTTGTWARGDIVYNSAPSATGFAGWVCVTAGTPGTWKGFGVIEA